MKKNKILFSKINGRIQNIKKSSSSLHLSMDLTLQYHPCWALHGTKRKDTDSALKCSSTEINECQTRRQSLWQLWGQGSVSVQAGGPLRNAGHVLAVIKKNHFTVVCLESSSLRGQIFLVQILLRACALCLLSRVQQLSECFLQGSYDL